MTQDRDENKEVDTTNMKKENTIMTREERFEQVGDVLEELDRTLFSVLLRRNKLQIGDIPSVIEQLRRQIQDTRYKIWLWKNS